MPFYISPDGTVLEQFEQPVSFEGEHHERINVDAGGIVLDTNDQEHLVLTADLTGAEKYIVCQATNGTDLFTVNHDGAVESSTITAIQNTLNAATENNTGGVLVKREALTHFENVNLEELNIGSHIALVDTVSQKTNLLWQEVDGVGAKTGKIVRIGHSDVIGAVADNGIQVSLASEGETIIQCDAEQAFLNFQTFRTNDDTPMILAIDSFGNDVFEVKNDGRIMSNQLTDLETNIIENATELEEHAQTLQTFEDDIGANMVNLEEMLNATYNQIDNDVVTRKTEINSSVGRTGLLMHCTKDSGIPYIDCEDESGNKKFTVTNDGTVLTHGVYANDHTTLPDNLSTAIAVGNNSVYIGQSKISYNDTTGEMKFYKLKDNVVPTALSGSPYNLTVGDIDAGKNSNTVQRWLDLARPSHAHSNLRIHDIFPTANQASDWVEAKVVPTANSYTESDQTPANGGTAIRFRDTNDMTVQIHTYTIDNTLRGVLKLELSHDWVQSSASNQAVLIQSNQLTDLSMVRTSATLKTTDDEFRGFNLNNTLVLNVASGSQNGIVCKFGNVALPQFGSGTDNTIAAGSQIWVFFEIENVTLV